MMNNTHFWNAIDKIQGFVEEALEDGTLDCSDAL